MAKAAITKDTLDFLKKLSKNNNKDWFTANKDKYEKAKEEFQIFIAALVGEIITFDPSIIGIIPSKTIFRIYRDVRFSTNKDPYKINFGAHIHPGDKQNVHAVAGYYLHIEPGKSFLAGGAYMPPSPWAKGIRAQIDEHGKEFHKIVTSKEFTKYFSLDGEMLQRPPQGYAADHPYIEYLKHKSFLAMHQVSDEQLTDSNFLSFASKAFKALYPFDEFLNRSLK